MVLRNCGLQTIGEGATAAETASSSEGKEQKEETSGSGGSASRPDVTPLKPEEQPQLMPSLEGVPPLLPSEASSSQLTGAFAGQCNKLLGKAGYQCPTFFH